MENSPSTPGTTPTGPLAMMSPDLVNQRLPLPPPLTQTPDIFQTTPTGHARDTSIHDKIQQFNSLSHHSPQTAASMTRQLERKTADAALKRAMLGREEAESEMRRYREEARLLRRQVDEGRERERKISERLETVMENYGRAKETYAHTQGIWEKEIRRARKETFKSQSSIVKLQEELKSTRTIARSTEESMEKEKERSKSLEQDTFNTRYQLVGAQEKLDAALARVKAVEQERNIFKTLAMTEEVARIAAEGRIPLPKSEEDAELGSPKKDSEQDQDRQQQQQEHEQSRDRMSLSTADILPSTASEADIDELSRLWQWEKQRADRTQEHLEFLQAECQLKCCPCAKSRMRRSAHGAPRKQRVEPIAIVDPADLIIMGQEPAPSLRSGDSAVDVATQPDTNMPKAESPVEHSELNESRRSTIFLADEGTFRTVSQQEMAAMKMLDEEVVAAAPAPEGPTLTTTISDIIQPTCSPKLYARTPSVEPPSFALMTKERTSLMSLLNAPHELDSQSAHTVPHPPMTPVPTITPYSHPSPTYHDEPTYMATSPDRTDPQTALRSQALFTTVTQTTTVPVRNDENRDPREYIQLAARKTDRAPSFDINNPALTPTMTREQALAQIRERRGRARSAAQGAITPRRQMIVGAGESRNVSAPTGGRVGKGRS